MPKLATTHSLSNYPKVTIASFKKQLSQTGQNSFTCNYSYSGKPYNYTIATAKTPCNYGGYRFWFICPHCSKRAAVLYCAGLYVCRHCLNANYATQLMQPLDKLFRKVEKIRHRLQWQAGIAHGHGHGAKPKGMHTSTYCQLVAEHDKIANQLLGLEWEWLSKLKR